MERKYELTKETNNIGFKTLYRIKALRDFANVKAGDLGGFIENEENLSHEGNCWVYGNARVSSNNDYTTISGFGSVNRTTTFFRTEDPNIIKVVCGCFHGTLNEFKAKVIETHKDTKYAKEYLTAIEMVKIHFEIE